MGLREFYSPGTKGEGWEPIPLSESQQIADAIQKELLSSKEVFTPRDIADMTPAEKMAYQAVVDWMGGGLSGVDEAINAVRGFLNADLSPKNIPGLAGLFKKAEELGASLMGKKKRGLAITGNLPSESSAGTKTYGRLWQDIMNEFITSAYPYYQQFINAKLSAPERLANLVTGDITNRIGAATTTGSLPRMIQQMINDAIFEAKQKTQMFPYTFTAPYAQNVMGQNRYAWNSGQPVVSEAEAAGRLGQGIASIVGMFFGGGAGAAAGAGGLSNSMTGSSGTGKPIAIQYQPSPYKYGQYGAAFPS